MKERGLFAALSVALLLFLSGPTAVAQKGSPVPEVGYRPVDTNCGVPAGDYGFFDAEDWWWAVYSNGDGVLKCETHLYPEQTPPAATLIIPILAACGTPDGLTTDAFTKITPDGRVVLICRIS